MLNNAIPNKPQPDHVLKVLESEIAHIISDEKKPGWTTWSIYGAIAAIIWLIFDQIEKNQCSQLNVLILFLILSLGVEFFKQFPIVFVSVKADSHRSPRFFLTDTLENNRYELFWESILYVVLIIIAFNTFSAVRSTALLVFICLYYGLRLIAYMLVLATSYAKLPFSLPYSLKGAALPITALIFCLLLLSVLIAYYYYAKDRVSFALADFKFSMLFVGLYQLSFLLIQKLTPNPLIQSLRDIRRNLAFGLISVEDAVRQADVAIAGMKIRDVLREDVSVILALIESVNIEHEKIDDKLNALRKQGPIEINEMSYNQVLVLKTIIEPCKQSLDNLERIIIEFKSSIDDFKQKVNRLINIFFKKQLPEVAEILSRIDVAANAACQKQTELKKEIQDRDKSNS